MRDYPGVKMTKTAKAWLAGVLVAVVLLAVLVVNANPRLRCTLSGGTYRVGVWNMQRLDGSTAHVRTPAKCYY